MVYQHTVLPSQNVYLNFFRDRGINVFLWNYRGYGRSEGTPSPASFDTDIKTILNFLRNEIKVTGKIGVYGRSMGGVAASIACELCDMIIVDRTFSSL
jgi:pimeloyl-ACP methyl ester carboxylesterase